MEWSVTKSKIFSICQRKWYYSEIFADPKSSNPLKREAYLLKQLQSVYAWRGSLVDSVISKLIIPKVQKGVLPSIDEVLDYTTKLIEKQLLFAKAKKYRLPSISKAKVGDAYCAFYELEYNGGLCETELDKAKNEIILSLKNLLNSSFFEKILRANPVTILAQRRLSFKFWDEDVKITCTPDMIVFFEKKPPMIVDWKVHFTANTDAWLQLGVYAVALLRVKPHKDFPKNFQRTIKDPSDIRLVEYQLLRDYKREYSISTEDVLDIEDYIFSSFSQMKRLVNGQKQNLVDINQFQTARSPEICSRCQFKKLCWKKTQIQKSLEVFC